MAQFWHPTGRKAFTPEVSRTTCLPWSCHRLASCASPWATVMTWMPLPQVQVELRRPRRHGVRAADGDGQRVHAGLGGKPGRLAGSVRAGYLRPVLAADFAQVIFHQDAAQLAVGHDSVRRGDVSRRMRSATRRTRPS